MKTHPAPTDAVFHFGKAGRLGRCRLRVFRPGPDRPAVVVATDLPGPGVTDAAEKLAAAVARLHGLDPDCVLWVGHVPGTAAVPGDAMPPSRSTVTRPAACAARRGGRSAAGPWSTWPAPR